jgi:hypothetical protein
VLTAGTVYQRQDILDAASVALQLPNYRPVLRTYQRVLHCGQLLLQSLMNVSAPQRQKGFQLLLF